MCNACRRVMASRGSGAGRSLIAGSHSNAKGASRASSSLSTFMPISVDAMLFAVDQVRVRVVISNPSAYRSSTISPLCKTSKLTVFCSGEDRSKAQVSAALRADLEMRGSRGVGVTTSPIGQGKRVVSVR